MENTNKRALLAYLIVGRNNMHILHWKACGENFYPDHKFFEKIYDRMTGDIDSCTEILLQYGIMPVTLQEALSIVEETGHYSFGNELSPDENYTGKQMYLHAKDIIDAIIKEFAVSYNDSTYLRPHRSDFESFCSKYLLYSKYLIERRLTGSK